MLLTVRNALSRHTCDSRANGRLMKAEGPFFIRVSGVRAPGITYPQRCRECYVMPRDARCYQSAIPAGSAPTQEHFVFRGALKVFPFPWCTLSRPSTALHRCREYATRAPVLLLANTSIRRAREWFSSWLGLPRFFGGAREATRDSYGVSEEARTKSREWKRDTSVRGNGGKRSERDQRVVYVAARGIMSSKYIVKFSEILLMSDRNSSFSRWRFSISRW